MSFDFSNNINSINKAQAAYKDGGGLGGGGMYMRQRKKQQDNDEDMFERSEEQDETEISFDSELKEEDIPNDTLFNKFVNWFRLGRKS